MKTSNISKTAFYTRGCIANESRTWFNRIYKDELAKRFMGVTEAKEIFKLFRFSFLTNWSICARTRVFSKYINNFSQVINYGCGFDTKFDQHEYSTWIEIDFPDVIDLKKKTLKDVVKFSDLILMKSDFSDFSFSTTKQHLDLEQNCLIIMEGVLPYLSKDQIDLIFKDIKNNIPNAVIIADFIDEKIYSAHGRPFDKKLKRLNTHFDFIPKSVFDIEDIFDINILDNTSIGYEMVRTKFAPWFNTKLARKLLPRYMDHYQALAFTIK